MMGESYDLVVARPAAVELAERLPEPVAAAAIELITGPLTDAIGVSVCRCGTNLMGYGALAWGRTA